MSSIAAAGLYHGVFREDMFEEAENLTHPYFASKHEAEKIIRAECATPWRIYRPGMVVGDSRTGEMDKIDGPYYFFKLIQKMRKLLPSWFPTIGFEGGRINLVPVDFVVAALVHLAHVDGQDGRCFHLVDPHPHRIGDIMNMFARAAHAPPMTISDQRRHAGLPAQGTDPADSGALTPIRRIRKAIMQDLGLPPDVLQFVNYPTRFDCRDAERLLAPAGITVPDLETYAWRLWDYWERHLDPDLFIDRSLRANVAGKVVLVSGGSTGIGKAAALKIAEAGGRVLIAARDPAKLEEARQEAAAKGLELIPYSADIADAEQSDALIKKIIDEHGGVDILVNNAGRSIRRGIESAYDRFHDYERAMQLNYFGCLRLTLGFLPIMAQAPQRPCHQHLLHRRAHQCAALFRLCRLQGGDGGLDPLRGVGIPRPRREFHHDQHAPGAHRNGRADKALRQVPMLGPKRPPALVVDAIIRKPARLATRLGIFGQVVNAVAPRIGQIIMNTSFRMFPDSAAAQGAHPASGDADRRPDRLRAIAEGAAFLGSSPGLSGACVRSWRNFRPRRKFRDAPNSTGAERSSSTQEAEGAGGKRPWKKSGSPAIQLGVPAEVEIGAYRSINDVFAQSVKAFSRLPAFISMGAVITYAELDRRSRDFAAWLQSLGLARGARVALMMPNLLQYPVALFGVLRAGYVVVNCNPLYTSRELQLQLADSGAEAIVVLENFAHVLELCLAQTSVKHVVTTQVGDLLGAPKGALVNFAAKFVKRMVPSWTLPGAVVLPPRAA